MAKFYKDILLRALADTPRLVSSNWVAVCVSMFIVLATFIIKATRQQSWTEAVGFRQKLAAMRDHWTQNLRDGFIVTIAAWFLLFWASLTRTLYMDHQDIGAMASSLEQKSNEIRRERDSLRSENDSLRERLRTSARLGTHPPAPHVGGGVASAPLLTGIRLASQKRIPSDDPHLPYGLEVVIQTDVDIEPVAIAVICDGGIGKGDAALSSGGLYTMSKLGIAEGHPNVFEAEWKTPAWTSQDAVVVRLFSVTAIRVQSVQRIRYIWP